MKSVACRIWLEDEGVLTFEWVLLITLLVIGVVGGYSALRDAAIDEMGDVADGVIAVDQSFTTASPARYPSLGSWGSYADNAPAPKTERGRLLDAGASEATDQAPVSSHD